MAQARLHQASYTRSLGDGLVLRWSTVADTAGLSRLYGHVFRESAESPPNTHTPAFVADVMSGRHPLFGPGDFALVEDTRHGMIVAATCLMQQIWEYEGIALRVGRPEIVATEPDYRNRGLIRAIFELIHARSAANGNVAEAITGIPYYYRQFGYEYAVDLSGFRIVFFSSIPNLKDGESEPYQLRDASAEDIPTLLRLYDHERARSPVSARIEPDYWEWVRSGQSEASGEGWLNKLIVDQSGRAIGYVLPRRRRWGERLGIFGFALEPGASYAAVMPSVLRSLRDMATQIPSMKLDAPPVTRLGLFFGQSHPSYDVLGAQAVATELPYAWYVRVHDLPGMMRQIAPVLERRLAESALAGHSGELKLNFYRGGLRLRFEAGKLAEAEDWRAQVWGPKPEAGFPPLVFLQLLFGRRSFADLRYAYPDVWSEDDAGAALIEALFPARPSWVVPLD